MSPKGHFCHRFFISVPEPLRVRNCPLDKVLMNTLCMIVRPDVHAVPTLFIYAYLVAFERQCLSCDRLGGIGGSAR